uniref:Uncharacterized protein n=1 Tax=Timema poppense TaxID=170557 RepID=A0A7R9CV50_TIMPO|nr:unnamed protein product [Timema poppensis]
MLYGISTGFGSPQVPVAELLARAVPTLHSPQKLKSSNFLQVPDIESPSCLYCPLSPSRYCCPIALRGHINPDSPPHSPVQTSSIRSKWTLTLTHTTLLDASRAL